jgi:hypothetical protein
VPGEANAPPPVKAIVNTLPFSTKEPARYQAEIVISFPAGDSAAEQKYFTARDGEKRRTDYEFSAGETLVLLEGPDNKTIVLLPQKKCSAEDKTRPAAASPGESFSEFLTTEWLAEKLPANFEDLGKEEINGRALGKFRVRFEKTGSVESVSEAIVWVDEEIGMPVKTEFYSLKDGRQVNKVTAEFRNLKLSVEPGIFDVPADCQNIPAKEMQKILRQERLSAE